MSIWLTNFDQTCATLMEPAVLLQFCSVSVKMDVARRRISIRGPTAVPSRAAIEVKPSWPRLIVMRQTAVAMGEHRPLARLPERDKAIIAISTRQARRLKDAVLGKERASTTSVHRHFRAAAPNQAFSPVPAQMPIPENAAICQDSPTGTALSSAANWRTDTIITNAVLAVRAKS